MKGVVNSINSITRIVVDASGLDQEFDERQRGRPCIYYLQHNTEKNKHRFWFVGTKNLEH